MRTLLILSLVGMGAFPALTRADSTPEQVTQSIDKLSSKHPAAREQAMKLLELAGEPALEALRKAALSDDIDVSRRAAAILVRIEKEVENRKYIEAPRYNLEYDDAMLLSVVDSLNRKLKTQLALDEKLVANRKRTVTFEVKNATAFETIAKFMEVAGLKEAENPTPAANSNESRRIVRGGIQFWGDGRYNPQPVDFSRIVLADGKSDLPSVNAGPLRIRVLGHGKEQAVRTNGSNEIGLKLDVCSISPRDWRGLLGIDIRKAIDEHGQNLTQSYLREPSSSIPFVSDDLMFLNGGGAVFQQAIAIDFDGAVSPSAMYNPRHLPVTFFAGNKTSRVLKEIQGVVHGRMLTPPSTLLTVQDVSKVSQKDSFKTGNFTLQILEVQLQAKKGQTPFIRYRMTTTMNPFQNEFGGQFGGLMLLDDLGVPGAGQPQVGLRDSSNTVVRSTPQVVNANNDGFTMTTEFQLNLSTYSASKAPLKLVVTGSKEVDISVPFTLKNIQLP